MVAPWVVLAGLCCLAAPVTVELTVTAPSAGTPVRVPLGCYALALDLGLPTSDLWPTRAVCDGRELPVTLDFDGTWDPLPDKLIFPAPAAGESRVTVTLEPSPPRPAPVIGGGERLRAIEGPIGVAMQSHPAVCDWDGDGDLDLLSGSYSRRGYVTRFVNLGDPGTPRLTPGRRLECDGVPGGVVTAGGSVYARPVIRDGDGDGDLDLLVGGHRAQAYYERLASRSDLVRLVHRPDVAQSPRYEGARFEGAPIRWRLRTLTLFTDPPQVLNDPAGRPLEMPELSGYITAVDWDGDGLEDLLSGCHSGFLYFLRRVAADRPVYEQPVRLTAPNAPVKGGSICVPALGDWDGDGDRDLLIGTEYGTVTVWENDGSDRYLERGLLRADGVVIEYPGAGCQEHDDWWGYAHPQLVDWDGDGDLDLLCGESSGYHTVYRNDNGGRGLLQLAAGVRIRIGDGDWRTSWRVRPALRDVDGDGDLDLIAVDDDGDDDRSKEDDDGYVRVFRNVSTTPWEPRVEAGERLTDTAGEPLRGRLAGPYAYGRDKLYAADWDGDGVWDLLQGRGGSIDLWRNAGTADRPVFETSVPLSLEGQALQVGGHTVAFVLTDWTGDGRDDLVLTEQSGWVRVFDRRLFDPVTPTVRIISIRAGDRVVTGLAADFYRGDGQMLFVADFDRCRPAGAIERWNWRTGVTWAGWGGTWLCASPGDPPPTLTYPLEAAGRFDLYVGTRSVDWVVKFEVRLVPDGEWFAIEPPVAEGDRHRNVELPWLRDVDVTGKRIEIRHVGESVYLDYIRLVRRRD